MVTATEWRKRKKKQQKICMCIAYFCSTCWICISILFLFYLVPSEKLHKCSKRKRNEKLVFFVFGIHIFKLQEKPKTTEQNSMLTVSGGLHVMWFRKILSKLTKISMAYRGTRKMRGKLLFIIYSENMKITKVGDIYINKEWERENSKQRIILNMYLSMVVYIQTLKQQEANIRSQTTQDVHDLSKICKHCFGIRIT